MKRLQLCLVMTKDDIRLQLSHWWKQQEEGNSFFFFLLQKVERNCMKGQAQNRVPESALNLMTLVAYRDFASEYSHLKGMSYD